MCSKHVQRPDSISGQSVAVRADVHAALMQLLAELPYCLSLSQSLGWSGVVVRDPYHSCRFGSACVCLAALRTSGLSRTSYEQTINPTVGIYSVNGRILL